jgi:SAM-dependent methyltransferase
MVEAMSLKDDWEANARAFTAWARQPGHDSYPRFHRDQFLSILPRPGLRTLDIGCGEGRLARDLAARGHHVVAVDASPTMVSLMRAADASVPVCLADAAALPLADGSADLVVHFMSLQDIDDMPGAIAESARVLVPGGRLCLAIVHPLNSAGPFVNEEPDSPFVIEGSYLDPRRTVDHVERDGLQMTFHSEHRPMVDYFRALERSKFLVEALREHAVPEGSFSRPRGKRWQRLPLFLHLRAHRA